MARLNENEMELVRTIIGDCKTPADVTSKLKELFAGTLETMLEAEKDDHLGYDKHSVEGNNSGNSRNGFGKKTIKSEWGEAEIAIPRDRNGSFEPKVTEKRRTRTDSVEERIMAIDLFGNYISASFRRISPMAASEPPSITSYYYASSALLSGLPF